MIAHRDHMPDVPISVPEAEEGSGVAAPAPRSVRFRKKREEEWLQLEGLVARALKKSLRSLSPRELTYLPVLYRSVLSSLSVARSTSLDASLIRYLEALAARAYLVIYASRRSSKDALQTFVVWDFPRTLRAMWREFLLSVVFLAMGVLVAYSLVSSDTEWFYAFMNPAMAQGRDPQASAEVLKAALYDGASAADRLTIFASFLFTHNARIGFMAFAVGFAAGLPTAFLLFYNGLSLGAFAAVYAQKGLFLPLMGWLLPHGVPELLAVMLCGAAGLHVGKALVFPGNRSVRMAMTTAGKNAAVVVSASVFLFFVAGLFEGFFRQMVTNDVARLLTAFVNLSWCVVWLVFSGRRKEELAQ